MKMGSIAGVSLSSIAHRRFMKEFMLINRKHGKNLKTRQPGKTLLAVVFLFSFQISLSAQSENTDAAAAGKTPAAQTEKSPLILSISKDAGEARVALDYSVRWDFSDLSGLKPGVKMLYSIFKSASSWDITENTRLKYYGFKTNPWQVFLTKEKPAEEGTAGASAGNNGGSRGGYKKHLRLSLSPLVDNFKKDFDENLRDALLSASFKHVSPEFSKLSASNKKMLVKDVLSVFSQ